MPALDHVVLRAADPAKLERFYLDVLRLSFEKQQGEFSTGIKELDQRNIVPTRGALSIFIAPSGFGKSWFLIHLGKQALMQRGWL